MKHVFLLNLLLVSLSGFSQNSLHLAYHDTHTGKSGVLVFQKAMGNFGLEMGLKYHHFSTTYDNQNNLFKDRVQPTTFLRHFGPVLGVNRKFNLSNSSIRPEIFFQTQYLYAGLHNDMYAYWGDAPPPDSRELYIHAVEVFREQHNIENILGVGFDVKLSPRIRYSTRAGIIECMFIGLDDRVLLSMAHDVIWELGLFYSVGVSYDFGSKD
ncbi:MAG: hypothetical protein R2751_16925 [Bacteroidales bacterium]